MSSNKSKGRSGHTSKEYVADDDLGNLVRRAQSQEIGEVQRAWQQLTERFSPGLYCLARRTVGNNEDAKDLVQDTMLQAFRSRMVLDPTRNIAAWLTTVLIRLCYNHVRNRRRRELRLISTEGAPHLVEHAAISRSITSVVESRLELDAILALLSEQERLILILRESEGYTYEEIALALDITVAAAKKRLSRAREHAKTISRLRSGAGA